METACKKRGLAIRLCLILLVLFTQALFSAPAVAEKCPTQYSRLEPFFTSDDLDLMREMKTKAKDETSTPRQRKKAERELLDWTQLKLKALGFKTRRRTMVNEEMDSGKETFLQVLEAPEEYPLGKVMRRVKERFGLRVGFNPMLAGSEMMTPAYYGSDINLIMLDTLVLGEKNEVPQVFLHEVRHTYYLSLLKEGKNDIHHGSISTVSPNYSLDPSGMYAEYLSFEEVSTYFRDAVVKLSKYSRGEGSKGAASGSLHGLKHLSDTVAENIAKIDWKLDPALITIDRRAKEVTFPIYDGAPLQKNLLAEISYPMPSMNKNISDKEILRQMRSDFKKMQALAKERSKFASEELKDLK
jgi:hypothetical protein